MAKSWESCNRRKSYIMQTLLFMEDTDSRHSFYVLHIDITWLTDWLTQSSWVLPERLPVTHLVKYFSAFYGTQRFITMFISALHWSLFWAKWIQSIPLKPVSLISILILSSNLHVGLPSGLFYSSIPTRTLYAFIFSLMCATLILCIRSIECIFSYFSFNAT
jgi:hypothetical protein